VAPARAAPIIEVAMGPAHIIFTSVLTAAAVILTYLFLVSTMFSIGLAVTAGEILTTLRDYGLMARMLFANVILVPLIGLGLVAIFRLPTDIEAALLLLASAPGGIQTPQFTGKVKGHLGFAAALMFLLSIAALLITPLIAEAILPIETKLTLPYPHVIGAMALFMLAPLLAGFAFQRIAGSFARRFYKPVLLISNLSFVMTVILTMAIKKQALRTLDMKALAAMAILIVLSMVVGWWLGGPEKGARRIGAVATSMRNTGICLLIAVTGFPGRAVDTAVLAFMALMVPPNMLFTAYHSVRGKRRRC
jgi:BASS family bile acid:Na+ symporter